MLIKTKGIVIRSTKYGETSVILDIYTALKGRQSYILNSVRSPKARVKQSMVALSSILDLVVYSRDSKNLNRIKEVKPAVVYTSIPFNVIKGTVALFMVELVEKTVKESEENKPLFEFIEKSFTELDTIKKATLFPIAFPILLMPFLGFSAGNQWSTSTPFFDIRESLFVSSAPHQLYFEPDVSQYFSRLIHSKIDDLNNLIIPKEIRQDLLDGILNYYQFHVDNFRELNSHHILREVLS